MSTRFILYRVTKLLIVFINVYCILKTKVEFNLVFIYVKISVHETDIIYLCIYNRV